MGGFSERKGVSGEMILSEYMRETNSMGTKEETTITKLVPHSETEVKLVIELCEDNFARGPMGLKSQSGFVVSVHDLFEFCRERGVKD